MAENSGIEWTDHTFNPWRGCTKVSEGCKFCYADTLSKRNPQTLGVWGPKGSRPIAAESYWKLPEKWDRDAAAAGVRKRVFCASLADVFEGRETMPSAAWVHVELAQERLFDLIAATPHLDWLLLTKRPENVLDMLTPAAFVDHEMRGDAKMLPNIWIGTSCEDQKTADERIPHLLKIPAKVRFLSCEPLLGQVSLTRFLFADCDKCDGFGYADEEGLVPCTQCEAKFINIHEPLGEIHWVIAGGESGPNARPMHPDWARMLLHECHASGVPFLFKQWGEFAPLDRAAFLAGNAGQIHEMGKVVGECPVMRVGKKKAGRILDGRTWDQFPEIHAP